MQVFFLRNPHSCKLHQIVTYLWPS